MVLSDIYIPSERAYSEDERKLGLAVHKFRLV